MWFCTSCTFGWAQTLTLNFDFERLQFFAQLPREATSYFFLAYQEFTSAALQNSNLYKIFSRRNKYTQPKLFVRNAVRKFLFLFLGSSCNRCGRSLGLYNALSPPARL